MNELELGFKSIAGKTILVVEDDPWSLLLVQKILNFNKVEVITAKVGEEGVKLFVQHEEIDLVVLDIKLPTISGMQVFEQMRKMRPLIPIIAYTAYAYCNESIILPSTGFSAYFSKPLDVNSFVNTLYRLLHVESSVIHA
jgi:Response regulator containing CheY-like receiver, AAA-type ATPase, and DNA-binding domains